MNHIQELYRLIVGLPKTLGNCETCNKFSKKMVMIESCERDECVKMIEEIYYIKNKIEENIANITAVDKGLLDNISTESSKLYNTVKDNCKICSTFQDDWNCGWEQCHLTTSINETVKDIVKTLNSLAT